MISRPGIDIQSLFPNEEPLLCGRCRQLDLWAEAFNVTDRLPDLATQSHGCEFCSLLLTCSEKLGIRDPSTTISVRKLGSELAIKSPEVKSETRVLSVCKLYGA